MLRRLTQNGTETLDLSGKVTTIGSENCDIIIEDSSVEPLQAVIEMDPSTRLYWLKDLNTTSGSFVNNQQLIDGQMELRSGDKIRFGFDESEYVFENNKKRPAQPRRRVWSGGASTALPNLHTNVRRVSPVTQKLVTIERRELADRPITQNRSRVGGYRERAIIRGNSLDRKHRRVIGNAWGSDQVPFNANNFSPDSSGSWDRNHSRGRVGGSAGRNASQAMRYMQKRIIELEAALSNDSGILSDERGRAATNEEYFMERLRRLEAELARKDIEIVSLRDNYDLESRDPITEEISDLRTALELSEREKAELRVNLSKARGKLEDRNEVITELVNGNGDAFAGRERSADNLFDGDLGISSTFGKFAPRTEISRSIAATGTGVQNLLDLDSEFEAQKRVRAAEIAFDVQTILVKLVISEFDKYLSNDPENQTDLKQLMKDVALIQPVVSLEEKYTDYEVKIRQELLKKSNNPLKPEKYTEDDLQGIVRKSQIDQEITRSLREDWKGIFESGARWLPEIVEYSREMSRFSALRDSFAEWTVELREEFYEHPISSHLLFTYAEKLTERFNSVGVGDNWLLSSLVPMLRAAGKQLLDNVEAKFLNREDAVASTELSLIDLEDMKRRQDDLHKEISKRDESIDKFEKDILDAEGAKNSLTEATKKLEEEVQRIQKESSETETEFQKLSEECKSLRKSNDKLAFEKAELQGEIITLTGKLQESEKEISSSANSEAEKTKLTLDRIAELEEICEAKDSELELMRKELSGRSSKVEDPDSETEEIEKVKRKLEELGGGGNRMDDDSARQMEILRKSKEQEIFNLRERIAELETEREELKALKRGEDVDTIPNLAESLHRTEELERQLKEKEETNLLLNDRLKKTIEEFDSFRADNGESQTSTILKNGFHSAKNVLSETNEDMDKSFWDLSNQLSSMLSQEIPTASASAPKEGGSRSDNDLNLSVSTNRDDRTGAAKEVVSRVQELLDRVRQQNEDLNTFRGETDRNISPWDGPLHIPSKATNGVSPNGSPSKNQNSSKRAKGRQKREKKDLPMKVVTFDIP